MNVHFIQKLHQFLFHLEKTTHAAKGSLIPQLKLLLSESSAPSNNYDTH